VLRGIDLAIPRGRRVALVGPNGSGKSTLNRVLMGLLQYEGEVRLDGERPGAKRVAARLAYVPQQAPQLAATPAELVRAIGDLRELDAALFEATLASLGLPFASVAAQPFRSLSGGTKQKLLVAMALATRASLLILDEPTGSLDPESRERCLALLDALPRDVTLLLCSHRLDELRQLVDEVVVLVDGRVARQAGAAEFLQHSDRSVIEVSAQPHAWAWLAGRGFHRSAGGVWLRTASKLEQQSLLPELSRCIGDGVADLSVRPVEKLALEEDHLV
jgi:ABC-type multidrug transport system ATPase subunit